MKEIIAFQTAVRNNRRVVDGSIDPDDIPRQERLNAYFGFPRQLALSSEDQKLVDSAAQSIQEQRSELERITHEAVCSSIDRNAVGGDIDIALQQQRDLRTDAEALLEREYNVLLTRLTPAGRQALSDYIDNKIASTMTSVVSIDDDDNVARQHRKVVFSLTKQSCFGDQASHTNPENDSAGVANQ
ncbi:MAG: hypothetical protein P8X82_04205 [Gemmatimonadales bacterium]